MATGKENVGLLKLFLIVILRAVRGLVVLSVAGLTATPCPVVVKLK